MLDQLWPIFDIFWLESLKALAHDARRAIIICRSGAGVHKTGIRGIQDTRQIVDGKTNIPLFMCSINHV